jgi:hypothetical protein
MALSNPLTLLGITPQSIVVSGSNPTFLLVDDSGILYNSRTGNAVSSFNGQFQFTGIKVGNAPSLYTLNTNTLVPTSYKSLQSFVQWQSDLVPATASAVITPATVSLYFSPNGAGVTLNNRFVKSFYASVDSRNATTNWTTDSLTALEGSALHTSATSGDEICGVKGTVRLNSGFASGTVNEASCFKASIHFDSAPNGAITTASGLNILSPEAAATTVLSDWASVRIRPISSAAIATSTGLYVGGVTNGTTSNRAVWIASDIAGQGGGITFGASADTSLHRSSAGLLAVTGGLTATTRLSVLSNGPSDGIYLGATSDTFIRRATTGTVLLPETRSSGHFWSQTAPTVAFGGGAGTSPTGTTIVGSDHGFEVRVTTGSAPIAGAVIFTVTYGTAFLQNGRACVSPRAATTAALTGAQLPYIDNAGTTALTFRAGSVALAATTAYIWNFVVMP